MIPPIISPPLGDGSLLLYVHVPLYRDERGSLLLERQACNGLRLWADHFERVTVMQPLAPGSPPPDWVPVAAIGQALARIEFQPLPWAYRPDHFLAHLPAERRRIHRLVERSGYLVFGIGGLFGDWGAVAALEAHRLGRPFAVWTDRVESEVVRRGMHEGPWRRRLRARLTHGPMARLERAVIRRAALGLFHGRETFEAYAPFCRRPELVHDIHISPRDHIQAHVLAAKAIAAAEGPLRLCYVGRADPMKGPLDWIAVLERLAARGIDFRAAWLGEGSERPEMLRRIATGPLAGRVEAPGFATDRTAVLEALRGAHAMVFCHKTPESPRCLIEALISGTPIIGYEGAFARDLISAHGGGRLTPANDVEALAATVAGLAVDRAGLADLIRRAARDGAPFDDESVFRHRSELIKSALPPRG